MAIWLVTDDLGAFAVCLYEESLPPRVSPATLRCPVDLATLTPLSICENDRVRMDLNISYILVYFATEMASGYYFLIYPF